MSLGLRYSLTMICEWRGGVSINNKRNFAYIKSFPCVLSFLSFFFSQLQYLNVAQSSFPLSVLLTSVPSTSSITEQSYPRLEKRQKVRISNANRSFDCRGEEHLVQCYSMIYWFRCREVIDAIFSVSPRFEEEDERYFFTTVLT